MIADGFVSKSEDNVFSVLETQDKPVRMKKSHILNEIFQPFFLRSFISLLSQRGRAIARPISRAIRRLFQK